MIRTFRTGRRTGLLLSAFFPVILAAATPVFAGLDITRAEWNDGEELLRVSGEYSRRGTVVTIENADTGDVLGTATVSRRERWSLQLDEPDRVPCRVRASTGSESDTRNVRSAPDNCDDGSVVSEGGGGTPGDTGPGPEYTLLAANDLGMHCADLDYEIFSILPFFNVAHIQVIEKGARPRLADDSSIVIEYKSSSSPVDPAGANSLNTTADELATGHFKTNYWDDSGRPIPLSSATDNTTYGGEVYATLYPSVLAAGLLSSPIDLLGECDDPTTPTGCPSILNLFEPMPVDSGLPVPDLNELAIGILKVGRQNMPGPANTPQAVEKFDRSVPFFTGFGFGHTVADANWWSAEGIPIAPVDDNANPNSYPLMRFAARDAASGADLASLDIVLPVASEADCQNCHADPFDCADPGLPLAIRSTSCNGAGLQSLDEDRIATIDNSPGDTTEQKLLNAAKINILRLHDLKHGDLYTAADGSARACDPDNDPGAHCLDTRRSIQCSQCHYSPALDLTQGGPVDEPQQGPNGRQQTRHVTMSSAMHRYHGALPPYEGETLFPEMPGPEGRSPVAAQQILEQTCYQCHPGKRTQCLRGAMFSGGVVCQDCHGGMPEVGNDFSIAVSTGNPGDFRTDGGLRVPWASEPGCQSCHTGDAVDPNHPSGAVVADDGIRLLQAYLGEDISVSGIAEPVSVAAMHRAPDSRFAENTGVNSAGDEVGVLYRLSKGHGGVMCEGCHNSTHAIWPNQTVFANDNIASDQLQGHHGTLSECSTCHTPFDIDDFKDKLDASGKMRGPHGMHPVASAMWNEKHKEVFEDDNTPRGTCESCHGLDGMGTVLSRTAANRTLECKNSEGSLCASDQKYIQVAKGTPIGCGQCHGNEIGSGND